MDIWDYIYFSAFAGGMSYSDISDKYAVSQSSLSKSLHRLENELGVTLFDRSTRPMTLTESGKTLKKHLDLLTPQYRDMLSEVTNAHKEFLYAVSPSPESFHLFSFFRSLDKEKWPYKFTVRPNIDFDYKQLHFCEAMLKKELDFAIFHDSVFIPPAIHRRTLLMDRICLLVPASSPLAGQDTVSVNQLTDCRFLANHMSENIIAELSYVTGVSLSARMLTVNRVKLLTEIVAQNCCGIFHQSDINPFNLANYDLVSKTLTEFDRIPVVFCYPENSPYAIQLERLSTEMDNYLQKHPRNIL